MMHTARVPHACRTHARRTHARTHARGTHATRTAYACLCPERGAALERYGFGVAAPLESSLELRRHVGVAVAAAGQVGEVQAQQEHVQQQRQPQQQEAARRRLQHQRARSAPLRREGAEQPQVLQAEPTERGERHGVPAVISSWRVVSGEW